MLYFQVVEGGHYFVFSICLKTVTMVAVFNKIQNGDGFPQTENAK
jgi:hypothetical protein